MKTVQKKQFFNDVYKAITQKVIARYPGVVVGENIDQLFFERFEADINMIVDRYCSGEYHLRDFTPQRTIDLPGRMREFFIYLQSYVEVGQGRASIFSSLKLKNTHRILNLCPGRSPKVELGLYYHNFIGVEHICDIDPKTKYYLEQFMEIFMYQYEIKQHTGDVLQANMGTYDFIVGNHIIDDIVVANYLSNKGLSLNEFYENENSITQHRLSIQSSGQDQKNRQTMCRLAEQIDKQLSIGGYIVINHYESYIDEVNQNTDRSKYISSMVQELEHQLRLLNFHGCENPQDLSPLFFPEQSTFILQK